MSNTDFLNLLKARLKPNTTAVITDDNILIINIYILREIITHRYELKDNQIILINVIRYNYEKTSIGQNYNYKKTFDEVVEACNFYYDGR